MISAIKDINLGELIKQIGLVGLIAGGLVYFLATRFDTNQTKMLENLILHANDTAYMVKELERMKSVLQQICANTSDSDIERNACFR